MLQAALHLLGNASNHISVLRRKKVLRDLNPDLQDLAEKEDLYRDAPPLLLGDGFEKTAREYTEGLKALSSVKRKVMDFRGTRPNYDQRQGGFTKHASQSRPYWVPNKGQQGGKRESFKKFQDQK